MGKSTGHRVEHFFARGKYWSCPPHVWRKIRDIAGEGGDFDPVIMGATELARKPVGFKSRGIHLLDKPQDFSLV